MTGPRKSPRKRIYQIDQYQIFINYDWINKLSDIEGSLSPAGFLFKKNDDYVIFYKIEFSEKGHLNSQNVLKLTRNYISITP